MHVILCAIIPAEFNYCFKTELSSSTVGFGKYCLLSHLRIL